MNNAFTRLWRIPLWYALWLALPLQLIMIWVANRGWAQYERNANFAARARQTAERPPFSLDRWRYFTQKELERSLYRATAPDLAGDRLESVLMEINGGHLGELNRDLPTSGLATAYPATLNVDGKTRLIKARYMGDNQWHWLFPQKSWRIKTKSGQPIRDRAAFNLKNPPTVSAMEDIIANELAAEIGLIAPEIRPVKMFVNGVYWGLYLWWDIADESLLRRYRRMPGSIYSGDGAPPGEDGVSRLFSISERWEKQGARNSEQSADRSDIDSLIDAVTNFDARGFYAYCKEFLDIEAYAKFVALDRLLGGQHHDYYHNHKLYFDPYKGRFEPIEWDFAFWKLDVRRAGIDQTLNQLLGRIRQHPEFELKIQLQLAALLKAVPPERMVKRIDEAAAKVETALKADGFRDWRDDRGRSQLRLGAVHSVFFGDEQYEAELSYLRRGFTNRHGWLKQRLADSMLAMTTSVPAAGDATLVLRSSGLVGQRLEAVIVASSAQSVALIADRNGNGIVDAGEVAMAQLPVKDGEVRFELGEVLLPGLRQCGQPYSDKLNNGVFLLEPAPLTYQFVVRPTGGAIKSLAVVSSNAVTGELVTPETGVNGANGDIFSTHPWSLPLPPHARTVEFGPGEVRLTESVSYGTETMVVFKPGTTIILGPDVSIEMRGKVLAEGTEADPILVRAQDPSKPWGVFALHGHGTSGSRFRHCQWRSGSTAKLRMVLRTGMVSIIETSDIVMDSCLIGKNHIGDDALHWGYVTGGEIRNCEFREARGDALDMDISKDVRVVACRFYGSVNDSIDLMTSAVTVTGCQFLDAGDKGISVGEGTRLDLQGSRFERCLIGIEIKDGSIAKVDAQTVIINCTTGVNLYRKNQRYSEGGTLIAANLTVVGAETPVKKDKRSTVDVGRLHTTEDK